MTDIGKATQRLLEDHFSLRPLEQVTREVSADGSRKYLFRLKDGHPIESVLIPERNHNTLCISSQAGCAQKCRFCFTGAMGFIRNLSQGEIVAQIRDVSADMEAPETLTNIVFMGMGEPLANYANLVRSIHLLLNNDWGFGLARRRVTVSTAGLVPRIADLGRETPVNLAVSLNATDNALRDRLMPINKTYPIESLLEACRRYPLPPQRRITFEYILLKGVNDSKAHARQLARLLRPIRSKINLIPFNSHKACAYQRPSKKVVDNFQSILLDQHYTVIVRSSKGADISAACGQLGAGADTWLQSIR